MNGDAQLWQICLGVTVSSVFSSLLDPAYKATITDLLTEEQYTKASGFVQIAGSAKYLISPLIAGLLLTVSDVKLLLIIDICTFFSNRAYYACGPQRAYLQEDGTGTGLPPGVSRRLAGGLGEPGGAGAGDYDLGHDLLHRVHRDLVHADDSGVL
ncbi:hypothetical protein ACFTAO_16905 [Paenibacillus rhizoplanae]